MIKIVHPRSVLMTGMFSCMFCLPKEHPLGYKMFVIYYKSKYSADMFSD